MTLLEGLAPGLLDVLWRTSWQVALLVAGVLCLELMLGARLTARWRYRLWLLVLLRLVVPAPIAFDGGVVPWRSIDSDLSQRVAPSSADPAPRPAHLPAVSVPRADLADTGDGAPPPATLRVSAGPATTDTDVTRSAPPRRSVTPTPAPAPSGVAPTRAVPVGPLIVLIWASGFLAALARLAAGAVQLRRRIAGSAPIDGGPLAAAVERCARRTGLRRTPAIRALAGLNGPAVVGVWRPTLVVPPELATRLSADELERVLLHELFHIRARDVAVNLAAALGGAAFWFHPLVHLARTRLRAAQESARDWQALDAAHGAPIEGYARALVDLAHGREAAVPSTALPLSRAGRDLERRILMIANYSNRPHRSWLVGAPLVLALGWVGFTDATAPPAPAAKESAEDWKVIQVERVGAVPAWAVELRARLDTELPNLVLDEDTSASDLVEYIRTALGLNLVFHPDVQLAFEKESAPRLLGTFTAAQVFDALVANPDHEPVVWCLTGHAVYFAPPWNARDAFDLRLYGVGPLIERGYEIDELIEYVRSTTYACNDPWDYRHVSISDVGNALTVAQTDTMHAAVLETLERLLNDGRRSPGYAPPESLLASLADTRIDVRMEETALGDAVAWLSTTLSVPIRVEENYLDEEVSLNLGNVPADVAIDWIARSHDLSVVESGGVVVLREMPGGEVETGFHSLEALARSLNDDEAFAEDAVDWAHEYVTEMVLNFVQPVYWDTVEEAQLTRIGSYLIVRAPAALQWEVSQLLQSLEVVSR